MYLLIKTCVGHINKAQPTFTEIFFAVATPQSAGEFLFETVRKKHGARRWWQISNAMVIS